MLKKLSQKSWKKFCHFFRHFEIEKFQQTFSQKSWKKIFFFKKKSAKKHSKSSKNLRKNSNKISPILRIWFSSAIFLTVRCLKRKNKIPKIYFFCSPIFLPWLFFCFLQIIFLIFLCKFSQKKIVEWEWGKKKKLAQKSTKIWWNFTHCFARGLRREASYWLILKIPARDWLAENG